MQQTRKPVSKLKVALLWLVLIGNLVFWLWFWTRRQRSAVPPLSFEEPGSELARSMIMSVIGIGFLAAGVAAYFVVIATNCFTFNFNRPVFSAYKGKLYLAKIFVPMLVAVGIGLMLYVLLGPLMRGFGLKGQMAFMLPLFLALIPTQIAQMWVNIWAPITKKLIARRLAARGILPAQLQTAILVGISDPARSSFKKLTLVEDDIGALWISGTELVYWGDTDEFVIAPGEIKELERRADAGSTSMLSGTAHVILHVQFSGGDARQIRFHAEGQWTLGRNREAMDDLSAAITNWHTAAGAAAPPAPPGS